MYPLDTTRALANAVMSTCGPTWQHLCQCVCVPECYSMCRWGLLRWDATHLGTAWGGTLFLNSAKKKIVSCLKLNYFVETLSCNAQFDKKYISNNWEKVVWKFCILTVRQSWVLNRTTWSYWQAREYTSTNHAVLRGDNVLPGTSQCVYECLPALLWHNRS